MMINFFYFILNFCYNSASLHGGHYIKDDKWCLHGGRPVYMRDHEGGEITRSFFGIPNVPRGDPHSDAIPSDDARRSNIVS